MMIGGCQQLTSFFAHVWHALGTAYHIGQGNISQKVAAIAISITGAK